MNIARTISRPFMAIGSLFKQAAPGHEQISRPRTDVDNRKAVTASDHSALVSYSRSLFATFPPVTGAVLQKASYCIGDAWAPQYQGRNKAWGNKAEAWLWEWFKIADVRGEPYDFRTSLLVDSMALDFDGDTLMVLTSRGGMPALQRFPSHRIGSNGLGNIVKGGPYDGRTIYNGVIFDEFSRPIAFRILDENKNFLRDVSVFNAQLMFDPDWSDQGRGIPRLAGPILDWFDVQDTREGLNNQVKLDSFLGLSHYTETGMESVGKTFITGGASAKTNAGGSGQDVQLEKLEKGLIYKFKAGSGQKVEPISSNRPSPNVPAYLEHVMRGAFSAMEWPIEMYDPTKIGGAPTRLVVGMVRRAVKKRQCTICKRADRARNYAIGYAIKNSILPPDPDWWMFDWQMPQDVTVDEGRDEKGDMEALKMGVQTMREYCGKRNKDWAEERAQAQAEADDLCERADALAKKYAAQGMTFKDALQMLRQTTPNLQQQAQPAAPQESGNDNET